MKTSIRYVVEPRGVLYVIYDNIGGHKIDSFQQYSQAISQANRLNGQWLIEVNSTKRY